MIIDHLGIVVKSIEEGIDQWIRLFGYRQMTEIVVNTRQEVKVVFLEKPDSLTIKLIEPTDESSPSFPFYKRGGGLHHVCFKCDNITSQLEHLRHYGARLLVAPQPGEAFENDEIAFLYARQVFNFELIDTEKRAKPITK